MSDGTASRRYHSPLRERQAAGTREAIVEAAAEMILSDGLADFSVRDVAARADVSERTVYYHFPSRQAVLDGLAEWVDDRLAERRLQADPVDIEHLADRMRAIFTAFDELDVPVRALARLSAAQGLRSAAHDERTEAFRERFSDRLDALSPDEAERRFAVLRHLLSAGTWVALREEFGLDGRDAARGIVWAMEILVDRLDSAAD